MRRHRSSVEADAGGAASTWQVTSPASSSRVRFDRGSPIFRSPHAPAERRAQRSPSTDRVAVLWLRRTRPRRRGSLRRRHRVVLRVQPSTSPRVRPSLAGRAEPGRHHHDRLEHSRARRRDLRRVPLPGRVHRGTHGRPAPRHPLGPVGAHGRSNRHPATGVGRRRERARPALRRRDPPDPGRRQPRWTQPRPRNP